MLRGWRYAFVFLLFFPLLAQSETRVFTEFLYDESGNIVGIQRNISQNPPAVSNITPDVVRIGQTFSLTATGSDLLNATITPQDNNVQVSNISASATEVIFNLFAGTAAPTGNYDLTFSTPLGSTTASITIQPRAPTLVIGPTPITLSPGVSQALDIRLVGGVDISDNVFEFSISDPSVLSLSTQTVTIPQGNTVPDETVTVTAIANGTTSLSVSVSNLPDVVIPVFVTGEFVPPQGDNQFFAPNLGIELETNAAELIEQGPFIANSLGVVLGDSVPPQVEATGPITTQPIIVARGNIATGLSPSQMAVGSGPVDFTVSGIGLDAVTSIEIIPSDDVTLGNFTAAADGSSLTIPLTVTDLAAEGLRQIRLVTVDGNIPFAAPNLDRFNIAIDQPSIESINPIVVVRNTDSLSVTVRGQNLDNVESINILPATGMVGENPQTLLDGNLLTFDLSVPADEPLGERVLTITTDAGTSSATPTAANTFEVVNGPVETLGPVTALSLGVELESSTGPSVSNIDILASNVGINLGDALTGLNPTEGRIGTTVALTLSGSGLQNVEDILINPIDGISLANQTVNAEGTEISVDLTIAADASEGLRRIDLLLNDFITLLPVASSRANRFLVVGNQPEIASIAPNFIIRDAQPVGLTISGEFLDGATSVTASPPQGINISEPVVSADGRSLAVNVSADAGASLGQRVIVVSTPSGNSSATLSAANAVTIANSVIAEVTPVLSATLGIELEIDINNAPTIDRLITAPQLLVERELTNPPALPTQELFAPNLGMVIGAIATSISPTAIALDNTVTLTINGIGLDAVTNVAFNPADGITVNASPSVNTEGTQINLEISVAADAAATVREVVLETIDGRIAFADPAQSQLRLAVSTPQIDSIEPIQAIAGNIVDLIIRGVNLEDATAVIANPSGGITFATSPVVNGNGTELTIQMQLASGAAPGPRVISVLTPVGASDGSATAANTFTVLSN